MKCLLELSNKAIDLFMNSEIEEKRQLIKFVLLNLRLNGENLEYEVLEPFNLILACSEDQAWRP